MELHFTLNLDRRKSLTCQVVAYFLTAEGLHIKDTDRAYSDGSGRVAVADFPKPGYDGSRYDDFTLFMPYGQIHLTKGKTAKYYIAVLDISTNSVIARTEAREFPFQRRFSGRMDAAELTTAPVESIGNWPPPAAPAAQTVVAPAAPAPAVAAPAVPTPAVSAPAPATTPPAPAKAAKPKPVTAPPQRVTPLPPPKPPTEEEYDRRTMKGFGWKELTEDRRLYLQGQHAKTPAARLKLHKQALKLNNQEAAYWASVASDPKTGAYDIKVLEEGLKVLPEAWLLKHALATACLQARGVGRARAIVDGLEASDPAASPAERRELLVLKAVLAEQDKDYKKAINLYDQADELITDPELRKFLAGHAQARVRELMRPKK